MKCVLIRAFMVRHTICCINTEVCRCRPGCKLFKQTCFCFVVLKFLMRYTFSI
uniref:Uncharacterized protein n=1 Tax=Anguilla anguilla TaxID=7936 RepID=A0A0E9QHL4_ANGAN